MSWDFTLEKYTELCHLIRKSSGEIMTLAQFLKAGQPRRFVLILRHDVDRTLSRAIQMAQLEASLGLKATYYVRTTRSVFRPDALTQIHQWGHEIGYHYEVLSKSRGNHQQAIARFEQELSQFRQVVPVKTISMHGSPLLPWDNRDLWRHYDFKKYGLLGEAYLSIDYENAYYFTDTGRNWDAKRYNVRDQTDGCRPDRDIRTTDDLIAFLKQSPDRPVLISAHPERWTANRWAWGQRLAFDWIINQAKKTVVWQQGLFSQK